MYKCQVKVDGIVFPILGGRLLKQNRRTKRGSERVSNPWREAIEAGKTQGKESRKASFPILGGRLLKYNSCACYGAKDMFPILGGRLLKDVQHSQMELL